MRTGTLAFVLAAALLSAAAAPLRAQTVSSDQPTSPGHWEIGLDPAVLVPVHTHINPIIPNDALTLARLNDEFVEHGLPAPGPGSSTIQTTMKSAFVLQLHLLYQFNEWLAGGLEGGYGVRRVSWIDNAGLYRTKFFTIDYRSNILHATPIVKLGTWFGPVKPYVAGGAGLYVLQQKGFLTANEAEDADISGAKIVDSTGFYGGFNVGGGLEVKLLENGTVALDMRYHKFYPSKTPAIDFVIPSVRFAYHFTPF